MQNKEDMIKMQTEAVENGKNIADMISKCPSITSFSPFYGNDEEVES